MPAHAEQTWSAAVVHVSAAQCAMVVHVEQTRSAVAVHALVWYEPAVQAPEHALHVEPSRNCPVEHAGWASDCAPESLPESVSAVAESTTVVASVVDASSWSTEPPSDVSAGAEASLALQATAVANAHVTRMVPKRSLSSISR